MPEGSRLTRGCWCKESKAGNHAVITHCKGAASALFRPLALCMPSGRSSRNMRRDGSFSRASRQPRLWER